MFQKPGWTSLLMIPPGGNQCKFTLKNTMSIRPIQKLGTENPKKANAMDA